MEQHVNLIDLPELVGSTGCHPPQGDDDGREAIQRRVIGLQKLRLAAEEESAQAGFRIQHRFREQLALLYQGGCLQDCAVGGQIGVQRVFHQQRHQHGDGERQREEQRELLAEG